MSVLPAFTALKRNLTILFGDLLVFLTKYLGAEDKSALFTVFTHQAQWMLSKHLFNKRTDGRMNGSPGKFAEQLK